MNEEPAYVTVPALADAEELLLAFSRAFPRDKAQPCSQIAGLLELAPVSDGRKKARSAVASSAPIRTHTHHLAYDRQFLLDRPGTANSLSTALPVPTRWQRQSCGLVNFRRRRRLHRQIFHALLST